MKEHTLNLNSIASVASVECNSGRIAVIFSEQSDADQAYLEWPKTEGLILIVGHEFNCLSNSTTALSINGFHKTKTSLEMEATFVALSDVVESYQIEFGPGNSDLQSMFNQPDASSFQKTISFPLKLNYDDVGIVNRKIELRGFKYSTVNCVDCYLDGKAAFSFTASGKALNTVDSYRLALDGTVVGSLGLQVEAFNNFQPLDTRNLFNVRFMEANVPGLFSFSPQFNILAGLYYDSQKPFAMTAGYKVDYPFSFSLSSDSGLISRPHFNHSGMPVLTPIMPLIGGKALMSPHLIPQLSLSLTISNTVFGLSLKMDNYLEIDVGVGNDTQCPKTKMNVNIARQYLTTIEVIFASFQQSWQLWRSQREIIVCAFCDLCPLKVEPGAGTDIPEESGPCLARRISA